MAFMHYMSADFRSLIEALLDYIFELKSMGGIKVGAFLQSQMESKKSVGAVLEMLDKKKRRPACSTMETLLYRTGDVVGPLRRVGRLTHRSAFLRIAGKVQNLLL